MSHDMSPEKACTDARVLADIAYRDSRNLAARQKLYTWKEPRHDIPEIVLDQMRDVDGPIIDVGCGNGIILQAARKKIPHLQIAGLDLSPGMLSGLDGPLLIGNVMHMPFADGMVAAILALHMIFHLPNVTSGLHELLRVLSRDGILIVSTNGRRDKTELHQVWSRASADLLGLTSPAPRISVSDRFPLDDAPAILGQYFTEVRVLHIDGVATITDSAPAISYLASRRAWAATPGLSFDDTLGHSKELISEIIERDGSFSITCQSGILICRGPLTRP
jgi:SAM-dependent methyltransferase